MNKFREIYSRFISGIKSWRRVKPKRRSHGGACLGMQHYMGVCRAALVRREAVHESLRLARNLFEHAALHGRLQHSACEKGSST